MIASSANFQDEEESDVDTNNEEEKQASLWSKEPTSLKTGSARNGYTARDALLILVLAIATVFIAVALVAILRPRKATPRFLENEGNSTLRDHIFKSKQLQANASNTFLSPETTTICDTPVAIYLLSYRVIRGCLAENTCQISSLTSKFIPSVTSGDNKQVY